MNDYMFTIAISDGYTITHRNVVVSAENVEIAFNDAMKKVSNDTDVSRELADVKKL